MAHQSNRVLLGIALKVVAVLMFTVMLSLSKGYQHYPLAVIIFYRSFFALAVLVVWLAWRGQFPRAIYTRRLPAHLVRAIAGIGSMFFMFAAYQLLPLADATALSYLQPLLVALFAGIVLGEALTRLRIAAILSGFGGVIVMLWHHLGASAPNPDHILGAVLSILGAILVAIAFIQIRRLTQTEDTGAITFYFQFTTTCAAVAVLLAALVWPNGFPFSAWVQSQLWVWPRGYDVIPLIAIGVLGGIGQILMTEGFRFAPASVLAAFDYTGLIWAVLIGVVIFAETPAINVLAGAAIVIAAGLAVVWQEGRRQSPGRLRGGPEDGARPQS